MVAKQMRYYLIGNHDDFLLNITNFKFGKFEVCEDLKLNIHGKSLDFPWSYLRYHLGKFNLFNKIRIRRIRDFNKIQSDY